VRCLDVFFTDFSLAGGLTKQSAGLSDAGYAYAQFKTDVGEALTNYFKSSHVTRGNKAFDVHENTYRIDADVVAAFEHRRYTGEMVRGEYTYSSGTEFHPDDGGRVINWPHQH
jgi:hypothetical protein